MSFPVENCPENEIFRADQRGECYASLDYTVFRRVDPCVSLHRLAEHTGIATGFCNRNLRWSGQRKHSRVTPGDDPCRIPEDGACRNAVGNTGYSAAKP